MIIAIRQWKVEDLLDHACLVDMVYSTKFKVEGVPFYAEFSYFLQDIRIYHNNRLVTVIPNRTTDTDTADKLIVDAFQNNPCCGQEKL